MQFKSLTNNFKIPVLGLGTWGIGGFMESDSSQDKESIQAIKNAINLGYTHIDTAELYGAGHTEELVGKAIKDFDRKKLIITTKVFKNHLKYDDLISSCKASLKRLQTDYIDIYLIHAPNPEIPIKETMKALDFLVEQKLIKYIGVSNFSVKQMKNALKFTDNKIVVNQIPYNLLTRHIEQEDKKISVEKQILPYCQKNNIIVMAYRPIERGLLLKPNPILDKLSKKYKKTKSQIAINWLINMPNVITIPKSTNLEHLKENLEALGFNLDLEDIKILNETNFHAN